MSNNNLKEIHPDKLDKITGGSENAKKTKKLLKMGVTQMIWTHRL